MTSQQSAFGTARTLTDDDPAHPYLLVEHSIDRGHTTPYLSHDNDQRSFIVIDGVVAVDTFTGDGRPRTISVERLSGWHAAAGSVYRVHARGAAVVVEAGTRAGDVKELPDPPVVSSAPPIEVVSDYIVDKPWGHEVWYTANLPNPPYALKQIHMTAGHQSSLQSHRVKAETNYVVDGEATVLNGLPAPDEPDAVIDVGQIPMHVHGVRSAWSSAPGVLHRVIALSDYTSIEVSTPELDDVIRWHDDTGRGNGRVTAEHEGSSR